MNCAALPAEILEVELFGRDGRAGDESGRPGRLEQAEGGTLLLKEVTEIPSSMQGKLLRLLDEGEFSRVNGRELRRATPRIIATTQHAIPALVASGSFRADLYLRLQAMSLLVPPLRERCEELESLQTCFRRRFARDFGRPSPPLSRTTMELLLAYPWPGNVKELEDLMRRYVVLGDEDQLQGEIQARMRAVRPAAPPMGPVPALSSLLAGAGTGDLRAISRQAAQQAERAAISRILEEVHWNRAEAARRLRISYKTLLTKLAQADFGKKLRTRGGR
jgi:two-component system response regulator AtoC